LSRHDLFLGFSFFNLLAYCYFLSFEVLRKPLLPDLTLYNAHLVHEFVLGFEDVAKGVFVPSLELLLEVFKFLLESIHLGTVRYRRLSPLGVDHLLKVLVTKPELFHPEGFSARGGWYVQPDLDRPVV